MVIAARGSDLFVFNELMDKKRRGKLKSESRGQGNVAGRKM